ncbi:aldo/keto reductase [Arthrobacter sp. UM1]|uniref:aldo/keto reductase n=1 Tax=Arthrobacter sp. UM1 TaxID=2766776 RepID=UPI001CF63084|nr:aldo/keto reductase [Arthrobacter sp. UM1]MCB4207993.1 aldo/keto reductase [Arthrobacter sp. UM1]
MTAELLTPARIGGVTTTPLGLGTARLGAFWQGRSLAEGARTLETALDLGVTLIDTADVYARGLAERLVGRAVRRRPDVTVMTKVGLLKTPRGLAHSARVSGRVPSLSGLKAATRAGRDYSSAYVRTAAEDCLRRQGREALDVLLLHDPGAEDLRRGEFLEGVEALVDAGRVRAWGASVSSHDAAEAALEVPGLSWLQMPVNPLVGGPSKELAAAVEKKNVSIIGLAVLGDGTLIPRLRETGVPPAEIAARLAGRAQAQDGVSGVLLGMSSASHAYANLAAVLRGAAERPSPAIDAVLEKLGRTGK